MSEEAKKENLSDLTQKYQEARAAELELASRRRSLREIVEEHLASEACTPIKTTPDFPDEREMKIRRFLYALAVEADVAADKMHPSFITVVKNLSHPELFLTIEKAEIGTQLFEIIREIRKCHGVEQYLDRFEVELDKVTQARQKFSVPLESTDFVEGTQTVSREAMARILQEERAKGNKINKIVDRPDNEDPYLEKLRTDANRWKAIVDNGLPNVTGDPSSAETQVALHETIECAANAIILYETEKQNVITRRDADPSRVVGLPKFDRLYAGMNQGRFPLERIDRQSWFTPQAIVAAKKSMGDNFRTLFCHLPVLDGSLFVSRMLLLFSFQPMFPVVHFSMQLETLMAATVVVSENVRQMTATEKMRRERELRQELEAEAKANPGTFAMHQHFDQLPINAQSGISEPEIQASFDRLRQAAHTSWETTTVRLRDEHARCMAYYFDPNIDRASMIALSGFQPPYTDAQIEADRFLVTRQYLTNLWLVSMVHCQAILQAYEMRLLALLGRFLDTSAYEYWMQEPTFPEPVHDHVLTTRLIVENNAKLTCDREELLKKYREIEGYDKTFLGYDLEELEVPPEEAFKTIVADIPSSPTVQQMAAYHRHCYLLFKISSEQEILLKNQAKKDRKKSKTTK